MSPSLISPALWAAANASNLERLRPASLIGCCCCLVNPSQFLFGEGPAACARRGGTPFQTRGLGERLGPPARPGFDQTRRSPSSSEATGGSRQFAQSCRGVSPSSCGGRDAAAAHFRGK